jgi:hypothetical protein
MSDWSWQKLAPGANYTSLNTRLNGLPDYLRKQNIQPPQSPAVSSGAERWEDQKTFRDKLNYILKYGLAGPNAPAAPEASTRTALISGAPGISKLLGASQEEVDQAVAWKKEAEKAQRETGNKIIAEHPVYGNIVAGTAGALSGATLGATDAAAKLLGNREQLEKLKAQYPVATIAGNVAGGIGSSFALPGAGQALAAKGILAGKSVLPTLARAGLNAASFAVPTAITQAIATDDLGQASKDLGINLAVGTVLGAGMDVFFRKLPAILSWIKKRMTNTAIREGVGIDPRSLKSAATINGKIKGGAAVRGRATDIKEDLISLLNKGEIGDELQKELWVAGERAKWSKVDDAFDAAQQAYSTTKPNSFVKDTFSQQIVGDPQIISVIQENPTSGAKLVQELVDVSDKKNGLANIREYLQRQVDAGFRPGATVEVAEKARAAKAIRDIVDAAFVDPALKADYAKFKAIDNALTREEFRMPKPFAVGSQTAGRMLATGVAGGMLGGTTAINPEDPEWLRKAATRAGIGFVAGSLVPRLGASVANKLSGNLAARLAPLVPEIGAAAGRNLAAIGGKAATAATKFMGGGGAEKVAGLLGGESAARAAINAGPSPEQTPAETPADASVAQSEAQATPEAVQAAREKVNTAYSDRVMQALQQDWVNIFAGPFAQYGLKYEDFVQMVGSVTGGFDDPKKTARIVFRDKPEREQFLRDYDAALRFGQQDVGAALEYAAPQGIVSSITSPRPATSNLAHKNLIDYLSSVSQGGKEASEADRKRIEERIRIIAGMKIPQEQKKKMVEEMLASYGIDLSRLSGMGLYG